MPSQSTGIYSGNPWDVVLDEIVAECTRGAVVACDGGDISDDETFDLRSGRLDILRVDAVVADVWIRQNDDLTAVGRIGEDLLVTGKAGIENDLTCRFAGRPKRGSAEPATVL
jgi:hypothetical protein